MEIKDLTSATGLLRADEIAVSTSTGTKKANMGDVAQTVRAIFPSDLAFLRVSITPTTKEMDAKHYLSNGAGQTIDGIPEGYKVIGVLQHDFDVSGTSGNVNTVYARVTGTGLFAYKLFNIGTEMITVNSINVDLLIWKY